MSLYVVLLGGGVCVNVPLVSLSPPDDVPPALAVPIHPPVPAAAGGRAQRPHALHRGRSLQLLRPLRPPGRRGVRRPGHQHDISVSILKARRTR